MVQIVKAEGSCAGCGKIGHVNHIMFWNKLPIDLSHVSCYCDDCIAELTRALLDVKFEKGKRE